MTESLSTDYLISLHTPKSCISPSLNTFEPTLWTRRCPFEQLFCRPPIVRQSRKFRNLDPLICCRSHSLSDLLSRLVNRTPVCAPTFAFTWNENITDYDVVIVFQLEPTRSLLRKSVQLLKAVASIVCILSLMIAEPELTPPMGAWEPPTSQSATLWTVTLF